MQDLKAALIAHKPEVAGAYERAVAGKFTSEAAFKRLGAEG